MIRVKIGRKFGRLTVLTRSHSIKQHSFWECQCECGARTVVRKDALVEGKTQSCGCLWKERLNAHYESIRKHPQAQKPCSKCGLTLPSDLKHFPSKKGNYDGLRSWCRKCHAKGLRVKYRADDLLREKSLAGLRQKYAALRREMLMAYGGACSCCGESEFSFLTLEHIYHDGKAHRQAVGGQLRTIWNQLKREGWPKDRYTILCMNCNHATRLGQPCPHTLKQAQVG